MMFIVVLIEESLSVWKKTSGGSVVFLVAAFANSSALIFLALSMCSIENPVN
jgi:hypothetical protein